MCSDHAEYILLVSALPSSCVVEEEGSGRRSKDTAEEGVAIRCICDVYFVASRLRDCAWRARVSLTLRLICGYLEVFTAVFDMHLRNIIGP